MEITLKHLRSLLKTLEAGSVTEFEYQDEKYRLRLSVGRPSSGSAASAGGAESLLGSRAPAAGDAGTAPAEDPSLAFVTSPFVGTFYRSSGPEAEPFADVGASVKKGQTLCIVEAMKLMNEIEAEFACTIQDILVENGSSVEFGQKLFKVKKA